MPKLLDLVIGVLLLWGGYRGFLRGFVFEIFSLAAFFIAAVGSIKFLDITVQWGSQWLVGLDKLLPYVAFILLFLGIVLGIIFLGSLMRSILRFTFLGPIDNLLGAVLGVGKWAVLLSTIFWVGAWVQWGFPEVYTRDTWIFPIVKALAPSLLHGLSSWWPAMQEWLDRIPLLDA